MSDDPPPSLVYTRKSDDEIKQLALDVALGKVFGSWMLDHEDEASMCFVVLMLCGPREHAQLRAAGVTAVYEYLDKAGPRTVNGLPSFLSMQLLNQEDQGRLAGAVRRLEDFQRDFLERPL
jgi:hypothetical protein